VKKEYLKDMGGGGDKRRRKKRKDDMKVTKNYENYIKDRKTTILTILLLTLIV